MLQNTNTIGSINNAVSIRHHVTSDGSLTDKRWIWKDLEGNSHGLIVLPSQHVPGGTEENHKKTTEQQVSLLRFEPGTSRIQFKNITPTPNCCSVWNTNFRQVAHKTSVCRSE